MVASCCCGQCEIEVKSAPVLSAVCHCSDCQRRTGSAFGLSCYFHEQQVQVKSKQFRVYSLDSALGQQQRFFCEHCGSTLYWRVALFKGMVGVAGGCFAGDQIPEPEYNALGQQQCSWLSLAPTVDNPLTQEAVDKALAR